MLNINIDALKKAAIDFYNITKMKIVLFDEKRNILYSYPEHMCRFCEEIRKSKAMAEGCLNCDKTGFDICDKSREKYIYTCHMGLIEAISPILENGIIIGYMMLGQVLENSNKTVVKEKIAGLSKYNNINTDILNDEIKNMKVVSRDTITSASDMMEMCACYLWLKQIIKVNSYSLTQHLSNYIEENIDRDLSVKTLCKYLNISKSTLYKLSLTSFKMGVSDYIRHKRLIMAKELIACNNSLTIAEVAVKCGITDANYFTKVFKKNVNTTPVKFRNSRDKNF